MTDSRCPHQHPITGYRCARPAGHGDDHGARCRLPACGGFRSDHRWPR